MPRDLVFVSYSHRDNEWKDKILTFLKGYVMQGRLQVWADDDIRLADVWGNVIDSALERARVAVLVLSSDFVASEFIMQVELPRLLRAAREHGVCLCSFVVRAVDPDLLGELTRFQWSGQPEAPLDGLSMPQREKELVRAVKQLVQRYKEWAPRAAAETAKGAAVAESAAAAGAEATARVAPAGGVAGKRVALAGVLESAAAQLPAIVRDVEELPRGGAGPAGVLHGVPALPPHFVAPAEALARLKQAILEEQAPALGITAAGREGLYGQGGIGKSVLAAALARDPEVQQAFADGIFWVTLGQAPELVELQRALEHQRSGKCRDFETRHVGTSVLRDAFGALNCLLVLDDVWQSDHADAFQILGPRCRLLVTTRDRALLQGLGARVQSLDVLAPDAALELLAQWARLPRVALPAQASAIAKECGYLPLALALAGAQVLGGVGWQHVLNALEQGNLRFLDHPHGSVFKSLSASVSALPPEQAERYAELAIFPEDTAIPGAVIERLWCAAGLAAVDARHLLMRFSERALLNLEGAPEAQQVRFHDLQGDYLRLLVSDVPALHARLLDACEAVLPAGATPAVRWAALPEQESYLWQHLVFHALEAGRGAWLEALASDAGWLAAKARASGASLLQADLARIAERAPTERIRTVERAVRLESSWLQQHPEAVHDLLYTRLRTEVRSPGEIQATLTRLQPRVRLLHPVNLGGAELRQFRGHSSGVIACAYSPDASRILSASSDKTLREWDRSSGKQLRRFEGHSSSSPCSVPRPSAGSLPCGARLPPVTVSGNVWMLEIDELT